ncbi:MAG: hypothetical protein E6J02_06410 [Chloroflexi bacterium]|nr:MAG: hypothetical protein E6J02_06410 [Chloroflexota bacterium]TME16288.1 MAG: hypothetical protein E6I63_06595 [Chloroflexota bacterium]TME19028.1 MAG: hypothetical protein E6I70_05050 [Chloroflexota bacterium]
MRKLAEPDYRPRMWREGRAWREYVGLLNDPVFQGVGVQRGQGRPVLLVPGFMAGDRSLRVLGAWLKRMGYRTARAGIRFNFLYSEELVERLARRLEDLVEASGGKAAIIGHSRGGLLAKVVSQRHPELVAQVIALGSPLRDPYDIHPATMAGVRLARVFNVFRSRSTHLVELPFLEDLAARPLVPTASIYTRTDGVVSWHACLRGDLDCFEVKGTHVGLAVNPGVYRLIARRLAEVGR